MSSTPVNSPSASPDPAAEDIIETVEHLFGECRELTPLREVMNITVQSIGEARSEDAACRYALHLIAVLAGRDLNDVVREELARMSVGMAVDAVITALTQHRLASWASSRAISTAMEHADRDEPP